MWLSEWASRPLGIWPEKGEEGRAAEIGGGAEVDGGGAKAEAL